MCAAAGGSLSLPFLTIAVFTFPWTSIISVLRYSNWFELFTAMVTLTVSSVYSVKQGILLFRGRTTTETRHVGLSLVATVVYTLFVVVAVYWRGILDWLFRLRYGS